MKEVVKKVCSICGDEKEIKNFVRHKGYKDKHSNVCKKCSNEKYQLSFKKQVTEGLIEIQDHLKHLEELLNKCLTKL